MHLKRSSLWKCQADYNEKDDRVYILPKCIVVIKQERLKKYAKKININKTKKITSSLMLVLVLDFCYGQLDF